MRRYRAALADFDYGMLVYCIIVDMLYYCRCITFSVCCDSVMRCLPNAPLDGHWNLFTELVKLIILNDKIIHREFIKIVHIGG